MAHINAAVAIILDEHKDKVYISLRQKFQTYSDYWEFPGGKVEKNETFEECVKREIYEEVGITANNIKSYITKKHINKDNIEVSINFFIVDDYEGVPYSKENQQLKLVKISELNNFKFLPASLEIIKMLQQDYSK
ncbi:(deoxy)nucleoside triphosphate pyrophosphohydrolase [Francisella hispaniensis]|uniref:8-oxo-dGTP diphosphatase n=1 Tax=Francisella hispaniensis FSC454 TaxID=1088883 RepID=A0AAC9JB36_9GAMM|nr:(deoxy)nucleoside triphosphate pyrophosphohydrolase [Francisella hispaniensis]APD51293.1 DNA mismatch repair protein MutT [Francisella hispaniensis FSC454]KYW87828.1 DNA mismatch repair protein MutT [Francisella hispaniensis FSC454]